MPPKKKAANGYKFAEPLPKGTVIEDIGKKRWKLGPSIGKGGFGEIYSAQEESVKGDKYPNVVKIEPHSNGPLFVEINFYIRHAKPIEIESFKKEKGLKTFGMPVYYGSGSHEYKGGKYRFLVMDKFSTDLYKLYIENNKAFPVDTVFKVGLQLIDVLEYIHQRGYVHADIKAANVLLGATKETQNKQVYLVDFGLATKFTTEKEFKPNPKKAHDGTIEFLSRDAHQGVQTRRGDLEILAYNLIQWLGCKLPWEASLSDVKVVQKSKEENMSTVQKMIKASFGVTSHPKAIVDYLTYIKSLKFDTEPDYKKIKTIFTSGIKEGGGSIGTTLQFSQSKTPSKRTRTPLANSRSKKAKSGEDLENELKGDETPKPKKRRQPKKQLRIEHDDDDDEMETATGDNDDEPVQSENQTKKNRVPSKKTLNAKKNSNKEISKSLDDLTNSDSFEGYTEAMKEIMLKKIDKASRKKRINKVESVADLDEDDDDMAGFTDEMKAIAAKKKNKAKSGKRNGVSVATTSNASSKRGVVKPLSKRLQGKPPTTHADVIGYSDGSISD